MAKQIGVVKFLGLIGGISMYQSQGEYQARLKGGVSADRIATDPAFQRTRENGAEFGNAAKAGKLLRSAFNTTINTIKNATRVGIITARMVKVLQADISNTRGERTVVDGDLSLIEGMEFNNNATLGEVFTGSFTKTITRTSGECEVVVAAFDTMTAINAPQGATHCKIVSSAAELDFANNVVVSRGFQASAFLPLLPGTTSPVTLTTTLTAASTKALVMNLGILFYQEMNGEKYLLKTDKSNAFQIVKVDA